MSTLLALDNLATPLVGARVSWKQSLTGAQFGTLVGKSLFKVFIFTLMVCGYIGAIATWLPAYSNLLLIPVLPILVLFGVPLMYAYIKLLVLRLHGFNLPGLLLIPIIILTDILRIFTSAAIDVLSHNRHIIVLISAYALQRSLMFIMLILMASPSPKKVRFATAATGPHIQYFYIAYFFIVLAMAGVFDAGPLQFGLNLNLTSLSHLK